MKAVVAAFNQEKALVRAFSVITNLRMDFFEALQYTDYLMTMVPGQVVTNLSPSLQRGVARPGSTGDLFTRLLAAPDPGPVLVEDLPDVVKSAINPEHAVEQVRS